MCAGEGVPSVARRAARRGTRAGAAPEPPVRLTVAASGDLLIHSPVAQRALALGGGRRYDFAPLFAPVRRRIAGADLALCHMETPLVPGPVQGYPVFHTPPDLARSSARWAGTRAARPRTTRSTPASTESTPRCARCAGAGVKATGTSRSARARRRTTMLRVKGVRVAFLSYTAVTNGQAVPHPWSVNWASPGPILRDARRARRRGARIVIVNLHWGTEFVAAVEPAAARARTAAHPLARDRRHRRPARARRAADPARARQAGRVRRGQPDLEPDGGLLPGRLPGRPDRADRLRGQAGPTVRTPAGSVTSPPGCATPTTP